MEEINIRRMEEQDIPRVLEVESASFTTPWPPDIFYHEVKDNPYAIYFLLEREKEIVGYCGVWIVLGEAQITNIAVKPKWQGKGYGQMLFEYVIEYAKLQGASRLSLEVRVSNRAAQSMYKKFGLISGGIRRNYYTDNNEDALVMWVNL